MKIILYKPQIPQNTGNIVRTCKLTGSELILVPPFGFSISDRMLKRAGLDYWDGAKVTVLENLFNFLEKSENNFYFFSSKARLFYTEISYTPTDMLIFGSETEGLPRAYFEKWPEKFVTIPMKPTGRCLNLSNSVAIGIYEAWRQISFA